MNPLPRQTWPGWMGGGVIPLEDGARGSGERRGEAGIAYHPLADGYYPTCSLHGAMVAIGGGEDDMKWRCLVTGCNVGCITERPYSTVVQA